MRKVLIILSVTVILFIAIMVKTDTKASIEISKADLYSKGEYSNLLKYQGVEVVFNFVVCKQDGVEYPAYCLDVSKPGVEAGEYSVSVDRLITNVMVWRAIINGYPYKTYQELRMYK